MSSSMIINSSISALGGIIGAEESNWITSYDAGFVYDEAAYLAYFACLFYYFFVYFDKVCWGWTWRGFWFIFYAFYAFLLFFPFFP